MTANRDLKRRVRDRQVHTGESYMAALHQVLAQRSAGLSTAIPTVEFMDVSELAAALGFKCRLAASPAIAHGVDLEATLRRFQRMLKVTQHDPALGLMRAIALRGEHVRVELTPASFEAGRAFMQRIRSGLGGVSDTGSMLALRPVLRAHPSGRSPGAPDVPGDRGAGPDPETAQLAPDEPVALFSFWLGSGVLAVPGPTSVVSLRPTRPPLIIVTLLDEALHDPMTFARAHADELRARTRGTP